MSNLMIEEKDVFFVGFRWFWKEIHSIFYHFLNIYILCFSCFLLLVLWIFSCFNVKIKQICFCLFFSIMMEMNVYGVSVMTLLGLKKRCFIFEWKYLKNSSYGNILQMQLESIIMVSNLFLHLQLLQF